MAETDYSQLANQGIWTLSKRAARKVNELSLVSDPRFAFFDFGTPAEATFPMRALIHQVVYEYRKLASKMIVRPTLHATTDPEYKKATAGRMHKILSVYTQSGVIKREINRNDLARLAFTIDCVGYIYYNAWDKGMVNFLADKAEQPKRLIENFLLCAINFFHGEVPSTLHGMRTHQQEMLISDDNPIADSHALISIITGDAKGPSYEQWMNEYSQLTKLACEDPALFLRMTKGGDCFDSDCSGGCVKEWEEASKKGLAPSYADWL